MAEVARHSPIASLRRVRLVAAQTFTEVLHLRLVWLPVLAGTMLVLAARWLQDFNFGAAELKFLTDFGLGVIGLMGTLLAALATAHLFFSDIVNGGVGWVLTRPVRRWEYLGGKLAGVMALLALFVAGLALVLAMVIGSRAAQLGVAGVPLQIFGQASALVWLKLSLVAAMTLLVCSYAGSALFAGCAGLLLAVVAHLRPFIEVSGSLAWLRLWPNLGLFDTEPLLTGGGLAPAALAGLVGYWAVFMALFAGLAAYVFHRREF